MILPTSKLAALSIALFVSSTVASVEIGNKRDDNGEEVDEECAATIYSFDRMPKECAYKKAIEWGRTKPYADVYHDDNMYDVCSNAGFILNKFPKHCILNLIEKWDKENPPPTENNEDGSNEDENNEDENNEDESNEDESNEDESNEDENNDDESNEDESNEDASNEDETNEDDAVSIRYPSGEVRPLVDDIWYEGVECSKLAADNFIPHECIYRSVCFGTQGGVLMACTQSPKFFKQTVYDRKDLDPSCNFHMFCKRQKKPVQQSKEDQEREKNKESFIERNKPTLDKSGSNN